MRKAWIALTLAWTAAMLVGTHWPNLDVAGRLGVRNSDVPLGLDKWLHIGAYGVLAWLVMGLRYSPGHARGRKKGSDPFLDVDPFLDGNPVGEPTHGGQARPLKRDSEKKGSDPFLTFDPFLTLAFLLVLAALDEWTQSFVPGRQGSWQDWVASSCGAVVGVAAFLLQRRLTNHDGSFVAHSRIVSALTLLSRLFGLVREHVMERVFKLAAEFDAFTLAFLIPNLFRRLFGEGALSAAFIPIYTQLRQKGDDPLFVGPHGGQARPLMPDPRPLTPDPAVQFAGVVLGGMTLVLGLLAAGVAVGAGLAGAWLDLSARDQMVMQLTVVTIFYMPLICVSAVMGGLVQVHGRFGPFAASPILLNLMMIGTAWVGYYHLFEGATRLRDTALLVSAGVVFSGLLQVGWGLHAMRQSGLPLGAMAAAFGHLRQTIRQPELRQALKKLWATAWPMALGLSVFQLNALADSVMALLLSATPESGPTFELLGRAVEYPMIAGDLAALGRAQLLYEFPHGVFGIAVATAIFPALAKAADRADEYARLMRQGLRLCVFIGLPAAVGLVLLRLPVCRAMYAHEESALRVAPILAAFAPALWAYSLNMVLTRAFYARGDTRTPMKISLAMVGLNLPLNLLLVWPMGAAGLAASTAACAVVQSVVLLALVRRHVSSPMGGGVVASWAKAFFAASVMGAAVWGAMQAMDLQAASRPVMIAAVLGLSALGAGVMFVMAVALKMPEPRWLLR